MEKKLTDIKIEEIIKETNASFAIEDMHFTCEENEIRKQLLRGDISESMAIAAMRKCRQSNG